MRVFVSKGHAARFIGGILGIIAIGLGCGFYPEITLTIALVAFVGVSAAIVLGTIYLVTS